MTLALQKLPALATNSQQLPAGFDGGNGSTKLIVDRSEIRIPSYVLPLHTDIYDAPASQAGGLVEYVEGVRTDLIGQRWLAGLPAYQQSPTGHLRVVDDKRGKLTFGLHLLLGCLATLPHQDEWQLSLIASIQDAQAFGSELSLLLSGEHRVRFNNRASCVVRIAVDSVVEEGIGAIVTARPEIDPNGQTMLYDFCNGTCIISVFGAKGKLIHRKVTPGGVENLIDAIARNIETRRHLSAEGDRQIIRAGIEDKSFNYGTSGWNFRSIYNAELKPWTQSTLATALKAGSAWTPTSSAILAVGGGSELPTISQLLMTRGITPITEGCWANARGLGAIAQMKLRRAVG